MHTEVDALMRELKEGSARIYGTRLRRVYLYGSYARGEQVDGSDVVYSGRGTAEAVP